MAIELIVAGERCVACGFLPSETVMDEKGRVAKSHPVKYWAKYGTTIEKLRFYCKRCNYGWWEEPGFNRQP